MDYPEMHHWNRLSRTTRSRIKLAAGIVAFVLFCHYVPADWIPGGCDDCWSRQ